MNPETMEVVIEVPKGAFLKRELHRQAPQTWGQEDGASVDFVSPLPCPFNYGFAPGTLGEDGDPVDVVLLGPSRPLGSRHRAPVVAVVHFQDGGRPDPKWILSDRPLTRADALQIRAFFAFYSLARRALDRARGRGGSTRYLGLQVTGAP